MDVFWSPIIHLTFLDFQDLDLDKTITINWFTGLPNIKTLMLNSNKISYLPANVFNPIAKTITHISLANNLIKILDVGVFDSLLLSATDIEIFLFGNPWECNENILMLKNFMKKYPKIFGSATCQTPRKWKDYPIIEANIEGTTPNIGTTTTPITSPLFTSSSTRIPSSPTDLTLAITCNDTNSNILWIINLMRRRHKVEIISADDRNVNIFVKEFPGEFNIVFMEHDIGRINYTQPKQIECILNRENIGCIRTINKTLEWGKYYSICIMSRAKSTMNPTHCYSFIIKPRLVTAWISKHHQMIIASCVIGISIIIIAASIASVVYLSVRYSKIREIFLSKKYICFNSRNNEFYLKINISRYALNVHRKKEDLYHPKPPPLPPQFKIDSIYCEIE